MKHGAWIFPLYKRTALAALCLMSMVMLSSSAAAGDLILEKQLQQQFARSRELVSTTLSRMHAGKPYQISFAELTGIASEIKTVHAQISEKFEQQRGDMLNPTKMTGKSD